MGLIGGGVLLATSPWFSAFSEQKNTVGSIARIGVIGPGSRGHKKPEGENRGTLRYLSTIN